MRAHIRFWWLALATALVALIVLSACSRKLHNATTLVSIYGRAQVQFTNAFLLKPTEADFADGFGYKYAPLIIQEVLNTNAPVDVSEVFVQESATVLNGKVHHQIAYVWQTPQSARQPGRMQGIRMTLNSAGLPVIWEVLTDSSGADIIYVSQSVEAAALREFGSPLPGRHFAVERSMSDAPQVVVARVIEDGPAPMGPIIYLQAGTSDVSTIICRCMDAQAKRLVGTVQFRLIASKSLMFSRAARGDGSSLEKRLRLPDGL